MNYTLIASLRSPFARTTRLFLANSKIDFKFHVINYLENKEDAEFLKQVSPINKLPLLLDGEQKIFDSRVIFNYLTQKHELKKLTLHEENVLTAIYGCLDVSVNLLMFKMGGLTLAEDDWYASRQRSRVPHAMEFILPWAHAQTEWNYPAMALYSYLDWAHFRKLPEVTGLNGVTEFMEKFKNATGVSETDFRTI